MSNPLALERVGVIGTGILGAQIAMLAAHTGYKVKIYDSREGAFLETFERIRSDLKFKGIEPIIPWDQWDACAKAVQQEAEMAERQSVMPS